MIERRGKEEGGVKRRGGRGVGGGLVIEYEKEETHDIICLLT